MKGIEALLQGIAVAAYTSGWWAVGVFGMDSIVVNIVLAVLIFTTIMGIVMGICWLSDHWND